MYQNWEWGEWVVFGKGGISSKLSYVTMVVYYKGSEGSAGKIYWMSALLEGDSVDIWIVSLLLIAKTCADGRELETIEKVIGWLCLFYRKIELKVNKAKSKVMQAVKDGIIGEMNVVLDVQVLEEVEASKNHGILDMVGCQCEQKYSWVFWRALQY